MVAGIRGSRPVTLQPQSGSKERWMLVLGSLSPFCPVLDSSLGDGTAHILGRSSPLG